MYKFLGLCLVWLWASGGAHPFSAKETADWNNFKNKYGKSYKTVAEEQLRKEVFSNNLKIVENHNKRFEEGKTTFTLGINTFADLSVAEFKKLMNGYKIRNINSNNEVNTSAENKALPASLDWRTKGAVTGVKNQAQCGSCWAFSATGSLEGQIFLKKGKLVSLSEQNLMDCSNGYGNMGCEGGLMDQAFQYVKANKGVDTEKSYPYEAQDASCRFNAANVGATLNSYTDVESGSESSLQSAVAEVGPISVAIDAGHSSFQLYSSGIYYEEDCDSQSLDHGVLAVGYGSNSQGDYWIVKNSWGESWGESGYILMARNKNNHCGIATKASYPNV